MLQAVATINVNKYKLLILLWAFTGIFNSCKLDPVVVPPGIGPENGQTVLGITINGRQIDNNYLNGPWKVAYTVEQYFDKNDIVISGNTVADKFSIVTLNERLKDISIIGFPAANGTYELNLDYNVLLIKLQADPFGRSANTPVRITYLNDKAMTWVAIDRDSVIYNGQKAAKAHQVFFLK